jgi:hypothetical protein
MITGKPRYIPETLLGQTLGKYQVKEIIGRGGMGVVFKVWDTLEERDKAIKIVPPELASSPLAFEDLKREISLAAGIVHPNVVKVLSLEAQSGQYFIVMEFIEGESLENKMARAPDRRLKEEDVIRIMKKAAEGIIEAHSKKVIHRDLKPRNIMESGDGQVKILDFGISHRMSRSMTELTGTEALGTWPYMAPEQLSNNFGREDQQVDVWSFGITMYQLLAGEVPFRTQHQIINLKEKPFPLEQVSKKTGRVVMKCLEKDRKKRYQDMTRVHQDLEEVKPAQIRKGDTAEKKPGKPFLEWPRIAAAVVVVLAVWFLYDSLERNRTFSFNLDAPHVVKMTEARQAYEDYIKQAEEAAGRSDYPTALSYLDRAKKIAATPRLVKHNREIKAHMRLQKIKTDFRQLNAFINSTAPREEKIEKSRQFLDTFQKPPPNSDRDSEILAMLSQARTYIGQLQVRTVLLTELPRETVNGYYQTLRRIEIPGLPEGIRVLGSLGFGFQVTARGKILIQKVDDSALEVTAQNQVEAIKQMIIEKLTSISLAPPRDKNSAPVKINDWEITFKVGTFQNKIILLYEG